MALKNSVVDIAGVIMETSENGESSDESERSNNSA